MTTIGPSKERVIVESDHDASIVELQQAIAKKRTQVETGIENSKVGDSNSNEKIERAIRNVEGMVRILRSALSANTGMEIKLNMTIVPWLVRHAAYILTRCRVRSHGKTSLQLIRGGVSNTELVPFGETVLFEIPKTAEALGSFEDGWESGVWLGYTIRDGMTLVGTQTGAYKVGTIKRKADGEQWSQAAIQGIIESPQQPHPGMGTRRITTFAKTRMEDADRRPQELRPPARKAPET